MIPGVAHVNLNPGSFAENHLRLIDFASLLGICPLMCDEGRNAPPSNEDISRVAAALDDDAAQKIEPRPLQALQMSAYVLSDLTGREEDTIRMLGRAVEARLDFVPVRSGPIAQRAILGRLDEALRDARESLWRDTSPAILDQVAGLYASTSKTRPEDKIEASRPLAAALHGGFGSGPMAEDHELDAIRNEPEFHTPVESARGQAKERLPRPAPPRPKARVHRAWCPTPSPGLAGRVGHHAIAFSPHPRPSLHS